MWFSKNANLFEKALLKDLSPVEFDYPFFAADLLNKLKSKGRIAIIPHSPYGPGITDNVTDALYDEANNSITLKFANTDDFTFYINRKLITQPTPAKYHVNDENHNQAINITFISAK